jgi:hypothetical protein
VRRADGPMPTLSWQQPVEIAKGSAIRGPWQMNESDFRWVDDPAVDVASSGEAAVVWVDQERKDVFFQRHAADGRPVLPSPTNVSRSGATFSWLPRVVVAPEDVRRVHVLWQEIIFSGGSHGGDILFASSLDGGVTFTEPVNLSSSVAGDGKGRIDVDTWDNGSLDLARSPAGHLYAVWTEYEGALWLRRRDAGTEAFSEPIRIAGSPDAPARAPAIAVGPAPAVHVAWAVGEQPDGDIHFTTSADGGRSFAAPRRAAVTAGFSDAPRIATDPGGTVHVVWAECGRDREAPCEVLHARGLGAPARSLAQGAAASAPDLAVGDQGRVHVAWEVHEPGAPRPRTLRFTYSVDGGEHFAPATEIPGIAAQAPGWNGSQQSRLAERLDVDANGGIALVNGTFDPGRASRVWLLRGRLAD